MAIWVLKDGQREGPYEERDVRELVYEGTYTDSEPAIRDGQFDWTTLGQILGRRPPPPMPSTTVPPPPPPMPPAPPPVVPLFAPPPSAVIAEVEAPPIPAAKSALPEFPAPADPSRPLQVAVTDFNMPFGSMVIFMVKWVLASIPALLILGAIGMIFWISFIAVIATVFRH